MADPRNPMADLAIPANFLRIQEIIQNDNNLTKNLHYYTHNGIFHFMYESGTSQFLIRIYPIYEDADMVEEIKMTLKTKKLYETKDFAQEIKNVKNYNTSNVRSLSGKVSYMNFVNHDIEVNLIFYLYNLLVEKYKNTVNQNKYASFANIIKLRPLFGIQIVEFPSSGYILLHNLPKKKENNGNTDNILNHFLYGLVKVMKETKFIFKNITDKDIFMKMTEEDDKGRKHYIPLFVDFSGTDVSDVHLIRIRIDKLIKDGEYTDLIREYYSSVIGAKQESDEKIDKEIGDIFNFFEKSKTQTNLKKSTSVSAFKGLAEKPLAKIPVRDIENIPTQSSRPLTAPQSTRNLIASSLPINNPTAIENPPPRLRPRKVWADPTAQSSKTSIPPQSTPRQQPPPPSTPKPLYLNEIGQRKYNNEANEISKHFREYADNRAETRKKNSRDDIDSDDDDFSDDDFSDDDPDYWNGGRRTRRSKPTRRRHHTKRKTSSYRKKNHAKGNKSRKYRGKK
jgi:hypothetical protein